MKRRKRYEKKETMLHLQPIVKDGRVTPYCKGRNGSKWNVLGALWGVMAEHFRSSASMEKSSKWICYSKTIAGVWE
jgi:hypothetical protein